MLLSAGDSIPNAIGLSFHAPLPLLQTAHVSGYLADSRAAETYRITLDAGDLIRVSVDTSPYGGGLNSYLRVFQDAGRGQVRPIASNDDFQGRDAGLTFQAGASGAYYLAVSSFDNTNYDPLVAESGSGSSHGSFDLNLTRTTAPALPLLAGSSFLAPETAVEGDTITVKYTVENRGAARSDPTLVSLVSSSDNRFTGSGSPLASTSLPALAPGETRSGSFTLSLDPTGGVPVFLGLQVGSSKPDSPTRGNDWAPVQVLRQEEDAVHTLVSTLDTARPIATNSRVGDAALPSGGKDFFAITLTEPGALTARVDAGGNPVALTLYDANGLPIVRSEGQSASDPGPLIVQILPGSPGGTVYYLEVASRGGETPYELTTLLAPSVSTPKAVAVGAGDVAIVRGDFNGDGLLDFATSNLLDSSGNPVNSVTVFANNGDGTFRNVFTFSGSFPPDALAVGDFNGDGRLDLAVASQPTDSVGARVELLPGNGDGTFRATDPVNSPGGNAMVVGDFNGDGHLDLAFANRASGAIGLLPGDGLGGLSPGPSISVPGVLSALAVGDFNSDGRLDLAVSDLTANRVTVFLNQGGGLFASAGAFATGDGPFALTTGDFNGDGALDIATVNIRSADVTVALNRGAGTFQPVGNFAVGDAPQSLITGDFNGDGRLDLAVANTASNTVSVLLNDGTGQFQEEGPVSVGVRPFGLAAGDFDGDGQVDLATANYDTRDVTVLLGHGDGQFPDVGAGNATGQHPVSMVQGDFNGDGRLDIATANRDAGTVTVLLGQGDGTFQNAGSFAAGKAPVSLAVGDFNGDGRLDLAVADLAGQVLVFLGNGTGQFQIASAPKVGVRPVSLVAGDFNSDGNLDIATADSVLNEVMLLLGNGDGTFQTPIATPVGGTEPRALVAGDFDGDGHLDLATANYFSHDVSVLLGTGNGSFQAVAPTPLSYFPVALVAGDFDGDTRPDLAFVTRYYNSVTVLLNSGGGSFSGEAAYHPGTVVNSLAVGDFNGDGRLDLATADHLEPYSYAAANKVTLLLGNGQGGFTTSDSFAVGPDPTSVVAGDFNGDGRLDLATSNYESATVTALLGNGAGAFLSPVLAPNPVRSTPLVARLTGTTALDAVVLTQTGQIEFRRGRTDPAGGFAPPVVLNPDPRFAARDLALVQVAGGGYLLAALSAGTFAAADGSQAPRVTLYQPHADGTFTIAASLDLPAGFLSANLASADLTGNGSGDLVITSAASDQVFVVLQSSPGVFDPGTPYCVGVNPSAIALTDVNGDFHLDIVVTSRYSGQVSVLINQRNGAFFPEQRFRAGTGLYGLTPINGTEAVESLEGTDGVVLGSFDEDGVSDAVVINRGTKSFSLLKGTATGGFLNPQPEQTGFPGFSPTAIVAGQFTTGDKDLDLAVLDKEGNSLSIFRGDGRGGFTLARTIDAGNQPTGISVADVSRPGGGTPDGIPDLLIGNAYGDLLILTGVGDGTFSPYRRADQKVSLAVTSSPGAQQQTFFFSNQGSDRLAFQSVAGGTAVVANPTVFQDRTTGIQAPGPQAVVTVLGTPYLLVANSGANELLIYTLGPDGQPIPASKQSYFTGTNPVSITTTTRSTDLNGDSVPDVVTANEGSNDVSIFLGQVQGDRWSLVYRPRQSSGGLGPTSVAIANVTAGDGGPDLLVSNGQSNEVSILASRGNGFFVNQSSSAAGTLRTGSDPRQVLVGDFDGTAGLDLATINSGSNDVTLIANFLTNPVTTTVSSGGTLPAAALALDVNGFSALLVANVGDGVLEILHGTAAGFEIVGTLSNPETPHLSDLVLVAAGNELEVYGADASREAAILLGTFGPAIPAPASPPPIFVPPSPGFESGLEIVSVVLIGGTTLEGADSATRGVLSFAEPTLPGFSIGFAARLLNAISNLIGEDAPGEPKTEGLGDGAAQTPPPASAGGILLHNLTDPEVPDPGRIDPSGKGKTNDFDDSTSGRPPGSDEETFGAFQALPAREAGTGTDLSRAEGGEEKRSRGEPGMPTVACPDARTSAEIRARVRSDRPPRTESEARTSVRESFVVPLELVERDPIEVTSDKAAGAAVLAALPSLIPPTIPPSQPGRAKAVSPPGTTDRHPPKK